MRIIKFFVLLSMSFLFLKGNAQIKFVDIPAGSFYMGTNGPRKHFDEAPIHKVTITKSFKMSSTVITNAMYEEFDPSHKQLRGKNGFSHLDNDAVVYVSWYDAVAFCEWLSKREGKTYRLPTEAEWEYAARAGTSFPYYSGWKLPKGSNKNNSEVHSNFNNREIHNNFIPINLGVKNDKGNSFGLYDVHGNVEEWCLDWYGPYTNSEKIDPVGYIEGEFKVTRGGSHSTPDEFLRSGNRMAMLPEDKHYLTGFRVVEGEYPKSKPMVRVRGKRENISQKKVKWDTPSEKAYFKEPIPYVNTPDHDSKVPFFNHNHCPAITWCPNGDLLAIWFSTDDEFGREMTILSSRLPMGKNEWTKAEEFYKVPDRNMTGSSLFYDNASGVIYHMNGVEAAGWWRNLAIVQRESRDNGATWTKGRLVSPEHDLGNQVIAGMFKTKENYLIQPSDATPDMDGGSIIHLSRDNGKTWVNPKPIEKPNFVDGGSGKAIAGIHAGVVQLKNGDLMALGRTNSFTNKNGDKKMPMSISSDWGQTWRYFATDLPFIGGGQRLVLMRLNEGPLLLVSFTSNSHYWDDKKWGMEFNINGGKKYGYGMYAALSYDEGKTWEKKKLLTDGKERYLDGGAWTGHFFTSSFQAEPKGYLAVTQTPDNMIHLISSRIHYRFNIKWIEE
ncbi:SUMF1/EgtB/PvdO family nonheme iron enzyme [Pseudopedobacter beijingensis]|uniref:SUMF1/EgtB/PvdO family nonheme iron enzyme n=1 Tax=Pseudopedobacter beijingensis TaxID=1207056 RepID=A0ABW4IAE0_9SPHI